MIKVIIDGIYYPLQSIQLVCWSNSKLMLLYMHISAKFGRIYSKYDAIISISLLPLAFCRISKALDVDLGVILLMKSVMHRFG